MSALDVVVIILSGIGGGLVGHWLVLLVKWAWDHRPHGISGRHDWIEFIDAVTGRRFRRDCMTCGRIEREFFLNGG